MSASMFALCEADDLVEVSDKNLLPQVPVVSVLMITYNHGPYLAEAIEGVVNQVCSFPFELIIGEDSSTDNTREVALAYQKRYPHLIRVVHSARNVGMSANSLRIFRRAKGKYVAYCEGDDFWCDQEKLAKQVTLMEYSPEIGIVHTDWTRANFVQGKWKYDLHRSVHSRVAKKYLEGNLYNNWHFPKILRTCTNLLRKEIMSAWYESGLLDMKYPFGDAVLSSWVTSRYKVGYIPAVTAVYRVSPNSALRSGSAARVAFYKASLDFDTVARKFFADTGYQDGYRWEAASSLVLWGARAGDWQAVRHGFIDFFKYFTLISFFCETFKAIVMRLPTLKRQVRYIPNSPP